MSEYKKNGMIFGSKGGAWIKTDTPVYACETQQLLVEDILTEKFDKDVWLEKLLHIKSKVFGMNLEEEYLILTKGLTRYPETYGLDMIDSETGKPKISKDGSIRKSPVPAHVKIVKQGMAEGKNYDVGEKIQYIVKDNKESLLDVDGNLQYNTKGALKTKKIIVPCSVEKYQTEKIYCPEYYYESVISVVSEILLVTHPELVYTHFKDIWNKTEKQLLRLQEKLEEEQ